MLTVEDRIVKYGVCPLLRGAGEERVDGGVAFTVERGEYIEEYGEHCTAEGEACVAVLEVGEYTLEAVHRACEIEREKSATESEEENGGHALHAEGVHSREGEEGGIAGEVVGDAGGCETTHH